MAPYITMYEVTGGGPSPITEPRMLALGEPVPGDGDLVQAAGCHSRRVSRAVYCYDADGRLKEVEVHVTDLEDEE